MQIAQAAIDILSLASVYALVALGIALIFGVMRLINFAHGELIMLGGYTMWLLSDRPWPVMVFGTLAVPVVAALAMDRLAFRPVRGAPATTLLITSFTISYFLQNLTILVASSTAKGVPLPPVVSESVRLGALRFPLLSAATTIGAAVLLLVLALFLRSTSLGIQMRGAAEDFMMARLLGVRSNIVVAAAFAISGFLAGVVALIVVAQTGVVSPTMGLSVTLVGFVATVIGGMGSIAGAVLGGFVLGVVSVVLQIVLPLGLTPYRDAFVFAFVIAVLLLRPKGLIAARTGERV
ncbi:MAG: branched-chain amino acid transport system permease protein [Chloroflexota bacterium]|nr:branched-chain amino acid transport system permease protein [Chloroflexota bacterium]